MSTFVNFCRVLSGSPRSGEHLSSSRFVQLTGNLHNKLYKFPGAVRSLSEKRTHLLDKNVRNSDKNVRNRPELSGALIPAAVPRRSGSCGGAVQSSPQPSVFRTAPGAAQLTKAGFLCKLYNKLYKFAPCPQDPTRKEKPPPV